MRAIHLIFGLSLLFATRSFANEVDFSDLREKYGPKIYQDVVINGQVVLEGYNVCDIRYDLIHPVLNQFQQSFTVLDVGAAQGYFSFRVAHEFSNAECVLVDDNSRVYDLPPNFVHS